MDVTQAHSLRRFAAALALGALMLAPGSAGAGTDTLKRGAGNCVQAPFDMILSPVTAGIVLKRNLDNVDDTKAVRYAYAVPGYLWLTGLHAGASVLRLLSGAFELFPGMVLAFTDAEMDPLFTPVEKSEAVVWDRPGKIMDIKLGVDYTSAPF